MSDPKWTPKAAKPIRAEKKYPCTQCGEDAYLGYTGGWDGAVKEGERLCTRCFKRRGGKPIFGNSEAI